MALPAIAALALKYGPALYSVGRSLTAGKSLRQKNLEALGRIAEGGQLPPGVLDRIAGTERKRLGQYQSEAAARLRHAGIRPGSPVFEEHMAAIRRAEGGLVGAQASAIREKALSAVGSLASMTPDRSTADLIGELVPMAVEDLQKMGKNKSSSIPAAPAAITNFSNVPRRGGTARELPRTLDYLKPKSGGY